MKEIIKKIVEATGYKIIKKKKWNIQAEKQITRENFFDLYFSIINKEDFVFVQIGANDGKTNDPIYPYVTKYGLRGIAIEAQPEVFLLLEKTYKEFPMVTCVNAAVSQTTEKKSFYTVKESVKTHENYSRITGIATFDKNTLRHTIKNKLPNGAIIDDFIVENLVEATTLDVILGKYNVERVDLLQLDCEGYDYEIIKMFDFEKFSPSIINFESGHFSLSDRKECEELLERHGYKWFRYGIDTCAYRV